MPTRHGGSCTNQDRNFDRRSARRTTTVPCSSTACTWKTPFARSTPTVLIFFMDGSRVLVSAIQLWHIDAGRGPSTPSLLRPSLLRQGDAEIGLAAETVDLVADDILADRRESLRVGEQHAADIVLEDRLGVTVEAVAFRLVVARIGVADGFREILVAPARAVAAGLHRLAGPVRGQDLRRVGIVPGIAEHGDVVVAGPRALQILAPFVADDLGGDADLGPVGLKELGGAPPVRHVAARHRQGP